MSEIENLKDGALDYSKTACRHGSLAASDDAAEAGRGGRDVPKADCAIGFKTDAEHERMLVEIVRHRRQTRRAFFETAIELEQKIVERERLAKGVA